MKIENLLDEYYKKYLKKTSRWTVNYFKKEKFPQEIIDFYGNYEVERLSPDYKGLEFLSKNDMQEENKDYVPGAYIYPLGFKIFAKDFSGNPCCIDTQKKLTDNGIVFFYNGGFDEDSSEEEILKYAAVVAPSFDEFIKILMELPEEGGFDKLADELIAQMGDE